MYLGRSNDIAYARVRRGRGQFSAPTSRSGRGYNYSGRSVQVKGDKFELTWNGPQLYAEIMNKVAGALQELSDKALNYMQSVVPYDTGALHDSCFVIVDIVNGRIRVIIGANTPYAVYVELGSSRNSAQPYIRPTYDYIVSILPSLLRSEVGRRNG